jgi:hypothetical protein
VINEILASKEITYDVQGIKNMCNRLREAFADESSNEMNATLKGQYTDDLEEWLSKEI